MLLAFSVGVLVAACKGEPAPKAEPPRPVRTVTAHAQATTLAVALPAEIRPRIESRYGFRVPGKISQRLVSVGDPVRPGQLLARLDSQDAAPGVAAAQAALDSARTDARLAESELRRQQGLREKNFISEVQLERQQAATDAALSRVRAAQAQLQQASNGLDFQALRADVAGHVIGVDAEAGQVVAAGQVVIRAARDRDIEALVNVPERDLPLVRNVVGWRVSVPALGERTLQGVVRELSPIADPVSRTYPMRLTLSGDLQGVQWGMTAQASLVRDADPSFVLPVSALFSKDDRTHVWVVEPADSTVRLVAVRTDGLLDDAVRVVGGLKQGDRVVTAGANLLVPGQKIRLTDGER